MGWPSRRVSVAVSLAPQRLWPYLTDIQLPARFSEEFQRAEWLVGSSPAVGAVFLGYNENPSIGTWQTKSTITAVREPEVFEWTVGDVDSFVARWRFEVGDGEFAQTVELGPGKSPLRDYIERFPERREAILESRLRTFEPNMLRTVNGIIAMAQETA